MALYRRGDTWHYDFTRDGHRHRGSTGLRDKKAASAFENRERERAALGSSPRESLALQDVTLRWYVAKVQGQRSERDIQRRVKTMLRLLGERTPITAIDTPQIADAMQRRRLESFGQGRAPSNSTVNRDLIDTTLRPLMRYARRVLKLPVKEVVWTDLRLAEPKERVRSYSAAELAAFRANLPHWHQPLFDFYARYGVRHREAFFPLDALDVDGGRVTLRERKNGRPHTIPLLPEDVAILAALASRARAAGLETLWFRELKGGRLTPLAPGAFTSAAQRAILRAGIKDARPVHDLRHHAGTAMLRATGNLQLARKLLGHESIQSTVRYAHASDDDLLAGLRHASGTTDVEGEEKPSGIKKVARDA